MLNVDDAGAALTIAGAPQSPMTLAAATALILTRREDRFDGKGFPPW
jgi:hypothetical protein